MTKPDKPTLDFSGLSWPELKRFDLEMQRMQSSTEPEVMENALTHVEGLLHRVLTYVPQSWLIKDAPDADSIDWAKPEALDWLQGLKMYELINLIGEERAVKN